MSSSAHSYKNKVVEALKIYFPDGVSPDEFAMLLEALIDIGECVECSYSFKDSLMTVQ